MKLPRILLFSSKIRKSWNWDPQKSSIFYWNYCHLAPRERRMVEIAFIYGIHWNFTDYSIFLRISLKSMGKLHFCSFGRCLARNGAREEWICIGITGVLACLCEDHFSCRKHKKSRSYWFLEENCFCKEKRESARKTQFLWNPWLQNHWYS